MRRARRSASPLLEVNIDGAQGVLFNITGGTDLGLFEVDEAAEIIKEAADPEANIIFGTVIDERMGDEVKITVIATGFDATRKPRNAGRGRRRAAEAATGIDATLDERSREILAEIERERAQRQSLDEQIPEPSPFATRPSARRRPRPPPSASRCRSAPSGRPTAIPTWTSPPSCVARPTRAPAGPMRPGRRPGRLVPGSLGWTDAVGR